MRARLTVHSSNRSVFNISVFNLTFRCFDGDGVQLAVSGAWSCRLHSCIGHCHVPILMDHV